MIFFLSKALWALASPAGLLAITLLAAFLAARRRPGLSRGLVGTALVMVLALLLTPLDHWVVDPLQHRFPAANDLELDRVDGIIVLGGAISNTDLPFNGLPGLSDAAERVPAFFILAQRYPQAKLVFAGGGGGIPAPQGVSEADSARVLFKAMGIAEDRVIYERNSRTTWENAQFSKAIVQPQPGERWLLVTSAWHMPRAVGCFRASGWPVIAWPVDYIGYYWRPWFGFEAPARLTTLNYAIKEWIGLVSYHLMGRTDAWLPRETRSDFRETPPARSPS